MMTSVPQKSPFRDSVYRTPPRDIRLLSRAFPAASFYSRFLGIIIRSAAKAKRGRYDGSAWSRSCLDILWTLESVGVHIQVSGIENLEQLETPCVVIANHMSTLETAALPAIIQPIRPVTFIVKQSLMAYPVFKHILGARDPIVVGRTNPRQDLKTVLAGGLARLQKGISIVVFPQTTRTRNFNPKQFNTIGVKLAQRASVPVVPLALLTDAWGNGKYLKDFGKIDPARKVYFAFGKPMRIEGRGADEHRAIKEFIAGKLKTWRGEME